MAFESVRALWNAIEGGSVTRKRLALALEKSSYIAEREAFCDLLVTTEAVEEMARTWGKWYWTDNVTKAWMYKMVDYTNDDEVRLSMMEEFAHGTVLTALTSTITEMMFALLERMMPICAKRDRVVLVMQPAEFLKEHSDKHVAWDLLGRYLVGFYGGRGVMVMPGFEFLTNENKLTDKQNRSSGLLGTKLMLDFGTLSANCPIEFDCVVERRGRSAILGVRLRKATHSPQGSTDGAGRGHASGSSSTELNRTTRTGKPVRVVGSRGVGSWVGEGSSAAVRRERSHTVEVWAHFCRR
jgi:hypothetical protein